MFRAFRTLPLEGDARVGHIQIVELRRGIVGVFVAVLIIAVDKVTFGVKAANGVFPCFAVGYGRIQIGGAGDLRDARPSAVAAIIQAVVGGAGRFAPGDLGAVRFVFGADDIGRFDVGDALAAEMIAHEVFAVISDHADGIGVGDAGHSRFIDVVSFFRLRQQRPAAGRLAIDAIALSVWLEFPCQLDAVERVVDRFDLGSRKVIVRPSCAFVVADEVPFFIYGTDGIDAAFSVFDSLIQIRGAGDFGKARPSAFGLIVDAVFGGAAVCQPCQFGATVGVSDIGDQGISVERNALAVVVIAEKARAVRVHHADRIGVGSTGFGARVKVCVVRQTVRDARPACFGGFAIDAVVFAVVYAVLFPGLVP